MARYLFLLPLLGVRLLQTCLQENLVDEDVRIRGGDGSSVCEGFPCTCVILRMDEGDGESAVCGGILCIMLDGITQDGNCLCRSVFCEEGESVVVECSGIVGSKS